MLELTAIFLRGEMQKEAPYKHGTLRGSIDLPQKTGDLTFEISIGMPYWRFQQFGTGIYGPLGRPIGPIYPVTKQCLKFQWQGATIFCKYVREIKGIKPNPFIDRAIGNLSDDKLEDFTKIAMGEVSL